MNLDVSKLREILCRHATDAAEPQEDGVFSLPWLSTETFYRMTEEYVAPDKRAAYKRDLERAFPGKRGVL